MIVQIYGVTTVDDAERVCRCGPDHIGVVLDEGLETWDHVDAATAQAIVSAIHPSVTVVGLSLHSDVDAIVRTVETVEPAIVHLARAGDRMSAAQVAEVARRVAPVQVMATVAVRDRGAIEVARALAPVSDYLLLDTAHPDSGIVGASGHAHDWSISADIVRAVDVPVILAGGLGPDNVVDAIEAVRPAGVDSETHTSRVDDRRRKDEARTAAFVRRARRAAG